MTQITEREFQLNGDRALNALRVYREPQAWKNAAYLYLSFPLGIAYFVFLVTGISLGAGLVVTLIGIPILLGVFYATGWLTRFESWLAATLIDAEIERPKAKTSESDAEGIISRVGAMVSDVNRWKGLVYLLLRFPLGVMTFVAATFLTALPFAMMTAPFTYQTGEIELFFWNVNTFPEAVVASILGVFVGALALRLMGGIAAVWRAIIEGMLNPAAVAVPAKRKNDDLAV